MKSSAERNKSSSMLPALSLNGIAGIALGTDISNKKFNCFLSIHQRASQTVYFRMKNEGLFPLEKIPSTVNRI